MTRAAPKIYPLSAAVTVVDRLDAAILREMAREKVMWWGSLDPRVSTSRIAKGVGVDRGTVARHLAAWKREGFLLDYALIPNPQLFGAGVGGTTLRVEDSRRKAEIFKDLGLIEGAFMALDHFGPWVVFGVTNWSLPALSRLRQLLASLRGVDEVEECVPFPVPRPTVEPTPLDWRIIEVLRAAPMGSLAAAARKVGVNVRTLSRRYERLVRGKALWFTPVLDFSRYHRAVAPRVLVSAEGPARLPAIVRAVREGPGQLIWLETRVGIDGQESASLDAMVHCDALGVVEDVRQVLLATPGVRGVEVVLPTRLYLYPAWFDERVARARAGDLWRAAT